MTYDIRLREEAELDLEEAHLGMNPKDQGWAMTFSIRCSKC
ncbi:MAG: hypothetical protein R3E54_10815 [Halioglobus sp.]